MEYRRFGKTEKQISVITLGGMRFKHGWDEPRDAVPKDTLDECINSVKLAFDAGINHIETAWGYVKSESVYGKVLNDELAIPRNSYHLMTKGSQLTANEMREMVEKQLKHLKTDYFDFYGWHGINNEERFHLSCKTGGPVEELLRMKEEGIIKHVGFSTHAPVETIIKAIETGLFEFVNLHYYYFDQRNITAVKRAREKDLGVFIISPNDKGGHLFNPPQKVKDATSPLTPIQWNARFCLKTNDVHTLTFGMTQDAHFKEMRGIFPRTWSETEEQTKLKLDSFINDDKYAYYQGYELQNDPSGINIPVVLRLRKLWKCYNMKDFGKYRYNLFQEKDHWLPGSFATDENIAKIDLSKVPENIPLKEMLAETHRELYIPKKKA
jgi:predicted aldo/keto reductase-like oxidoreductase